MDKRIGGTPRRSGRGGPHRDPPAAGCRGGEGGVGWWLCGRCYSRCSGSRRCPPLPRCPPCPRYPLCPRYRRRLRYRRGNDPPAAHSMWYGRSCEIIAQRLLSSESSSLSPICSTPHSSGEASRCAPGTWPYFHSLHRATHPGSVRSLVSRVRALTCSVTISTRRSLPWGRSGRCFRARSHCLSYRISSLRCRPVLLPGSLNGGLAPLPGWELDWPMAFLGDCSMRWMLSSMRLRSPFRCLLFLEKRSAYADFVPPRCGQLRSSSLKKISASPCSWSRRLFSWWEDGGLVFLLRDGGCCFLLLRSPWSSHC